MQLDFLAIGEILADLVTTDLTEDLSRAETYKIFQGGSPANVAANIKFLGKKAGIIGCVGNDGVGRFLLNELKKASLSTSLIEISSTHPTSVVLVSKSLATPDFIAYRLADAQLKKVRKNIIDSAAIIHSSSFALSLQPTRDVILQALKKAHRSGKTISIDWNFSPAIWQDDNGKGVFKNLMKMQPLIKFSTDDLQRFIGEKKNIDDYKSYLDKYSCPFICITCGKDGVWYKEQKRDWIFKAMEFIEDAKDVTGAGDAFWAGFICGYIDKLSIKECILKAQETAGLKIRKNGPLYIS